MHGRVKSLALIGVRRSAVSRWMGDIRFAICPVVRERKTEIAWPREEEEGEGEEEEERQMGKVEWQREPSGTGLRPLILPVCSCTCNLGVYTSLSAKSFCRACASERTPQLIKPPCNLYRHYTRCFACKNHLRRTSDCPPVLASDNNNGPWSVLHGPRSLSIQQLALNRYVICTRGAQNCETYISVLLYLLDTLANREKLVKSRWFNIFWNCIIYLY